MAKPVLKKISQLKKGQSFHFYDGYKTEYKVIWVHGGLINYENRYDSKFTMYRTNKLVVLHL